MPIEFSSKEDLLSIIQSQQNTIDDIKKRLPEDKPKDPDPKDPDPEPKDSDLDFLFQ